MLEAGEQRFGEGIWDLESAYYALFDDTQAGRDAASEFLRNNPNLDAARRWKSGMITYDPVLSQYYASLDKIEGYYEGQMYLEIERELGKEIWDILEKKYGSGEELTSEENGKLRRYWDIKDDWEDLVATNTINVANMIKPGPGLEVREPPGELGVGGQQLLEQAPTLQENFAIPPELLAQALGPTLFALASDVEPLPDVARRRIEELGLDPDMVREILGR
jgi:hypothetical protein